MLSRPESVFERAAEAILKRAPDAQAFAGADEPPITGHIPLPRRRPTRANDSRKPAGAIWSASRHCPTAPFTFRLSVCRALSVGGSRPTQKKYDRSAAGTALLAARGVGERPRVPQGAAVVAVHLPILRPVQPKKRWRVQVPRPWLPADSCFAGTGFRRGPSLPLLLPLPRELHQHGARCT